MRYKYGFLQFLKKKNRVIFKYDVRRCTNAPRTVCFGEVTDSGRTVHFWCNCFHYGNFHMKNWLRGTTAIKVNNEWDVIVETDPYQTTKELAAWFDVSIPTILTYLQQMGKIKELEKWVPHDMIDLQEAARVEAFLTLSDRYGNRNRKVLVTVWCSLHGVIHNSFLNLVHQ